MRAERKDMTGPAATPEDLVDRIGVIKQGGGAVFGFPRPIVWHDRVIGQLRPLTRRDAEADPLLDTLRAWRNRERAAFFTQFEATRESTRAWLTRTILARTDRIMFVVCDDALRAVGQCGLRDIGMQGAEIDAVIRGESFGHRKLMTLSVHVLVTLVLEEFGLDRIHARAFADNVRSARFFGKLGMRITREETFRAVRDGHILRYQPTAESDSPASRKVAHMELRREHFKPTTPGRTEARS
jgi:perosamine synthetase